VRERASERGKKGKKLFFLSLFPSALGLTDAALGCVGVPSGACLDGAVDETHTATIALCFLFLLD
jgi:hypothetical protein